MNIVCPKMVEISSSSVAAAAGQLLAHERGRGSCS